MIILLLLLVSSASIPLTNAAGIDSPMESSQEAARALLNAMNDAILEKDIEKFMGYQTDDFRFDFCYKSGDKVEMEDNLRKSSYYKLIRESTQTVIGPIRMLEATGNGGQVFEFDYEGTLTFYSSVQKWKGKMRFLLEEVNYLGFWKKTSFHLLWWQRDCNPEKLN